jgi:hypothetical protein
MDKVFVAVCYFKGYNDSEGSHIIGVYKNEQDANKRATEYEQTEITNDHNCSYTEVFECIVN